MDSAGEYRHRAIACLRLASEAREPYVKVALTELAIEFSSMADSVETCGVDARRRNISWRYQDGERNRRRCDRASSVLRWPPAS